MSDPPPHRNPTAGGEEEGGGTTPKDPSSSLLLAQLERRGLPPEVLEGLKSLPQDQLAAVLPALLQAVELEVRPLNAAGAADAATMAIARDPRRFGFLEADVKSELAQASEWNTGSGPVALGAFDAQKELVGFVIARVEATVSAAARVLATAAPDPASAAPLLQKGLRSALNNGGSSATTLPIACVALLGVDYALRGQGVGSALLGAVEDVVAAVAGEVSGGGRGKGRGGGGGAVALVAPEGQEEEGDGPSSRAPARFYAGRGYRRAEGDEAAALSRALAGDDEQQRRFGLWVKRVGEGPGAEAAATAPAGKQRRRQQQQQRGGGGKGGFGASPSSRRGATTAAALSRSSAAPRRGGPFLLPPRLAVVPAAAAQMRAALRPGRFVL
jgi:GNAT superfamily N-acetyltransferase